MKASDLFVKALEAEHVHYVFGIPGEENLDLLESLRTSSIKLILTRHEQAAGFMAATYGRLTGKAGVCLATLGPGATNFVTAAAYAELGGMPMLMLTGQKPIKVSKQGHFQIVDVVVMMKPLTKYTRQIVSADNIPARVREAFRRAEEERPGATHLELPEDIAHDPTDALVIPASFHRRPIADEKGIAHAVDAICAARHPLLMIGAAANRKLCSKMLREFVDATGIPFFTTQMGKGVLDETHPLWLGNAALSDGDFVHRAIERADCIINVGHDVIEKPPFFMRTGRRTVIHVNFASAEVDTVYFPQIEVIGDVGNSVWRMKQRIAPQSHWDFSYFTNVRKHLDAHLAQGADDARWPIYPQRLVADVRKTVPSDGIVCLDNGMYKIWFARYYRCREPNTLLLDNALATMGAGFPSAIAAKIVHPNRKVIAVAGDGGFMMNSQEIETAVRLKLDLIVLLLRDNAYGMIKWKQANMNFPTFGMEMGNPDFVAYAQSYGAHGHRPSSAAEFAPLLA
ncbi:MAG: acetolactate synthase large subunit, partial [Xanthomonadaceae bacterium]|nr:acetolactate synthase large subunit [Xanthomonadaceae bacterium]